MAASSCVRFRSHFHFRFGRKWLSDVDFRRKCAVRRPLVTEDPSRTVSEVGRRQISVLPVPVRPEVVSSVEMVADRPIHYIGVE